MNAPSPSPSLILCELQDASRFGLESLSPFCLKVHRALNAVGLTYGRVHGAHPGVHAAHNPAAQVPVLLVDGVPVADSTAILARVETLGHRTLLPADARLRAEALLWEELADTAVNGFVVASRWADDANWPAVRNAYFPGLPPVVASVLPALLRRKVLRALRARDIWRAGPQACWDRLDALLGQLDARAPHVGFWLGGEDVSVADVALFGQLRSLCTTLTPRQDAMVKQRAHLWAWLQRVDDATRTRWTRWSVPSAPRKPLEAPALPQ